MSKAVLQLSSFGQGLCCSGMAGPTEKSLICVLLEPNILGLRSFTPGEPGFLLDVQHNSEKCLDTIVPISSRALEEVPQACQTLNLGIICPVKHVSKHGHSVRAF